MTTMQSSIACAATPSALPAGTALTMANGDQPGWLPQLRPVPPHRRSSPTSRFEQSLQLGRVGNSSLISWYVPSVVVDRLPSLIPAGSFISVPNGSNTDYLFTAADAAAGATVIEPAPPNGGGWVATPQSGAGWASGATLADERNAPDTRPDLLRQRDSRQPRSDLHGRRLSHPAFGHSGHVRLPDRRRANLPANALMGALWTPCLLGWAASARPAGRAHS